MRKNKLIVIGGGAAGFFCAVNAARLNSALEVVILEKTNKLLSKVKVSGGGRCNTTHACFEIPELVKKYPRGAVFLKKAFHQFYTNDTINWFAERGVILHAESDGRMFPVSNHSQTIIDCLLREADKYNVIVKTQCEVKGIEVINNMFTLTTTSTNMQANYLCVAAGGFPKSDMFEWLRLTGHHIQPPVPSLFTFNIPNNPISKLMGLSVNNAVVKVIGTKLKEMGPLLITHWGLSGPVVLKLSAWGARDLAAMNYQFNIQVNWLGELTEASLREDWTSYRDNYHAQKVMNRNPFGLPSRLWEFILNQCEIDTNTRWAELKSKEQNKLIQLLTAYPFIVNGKTIFKEEFVTCGGVMLHEIDPQTMGSKKNPHLFFAGEVMDVDGITGGFNFQHAWTSGWIAAKSIALQNNQ